MDIQPANGTTLDFTDDLQNQPTSTVTPPPQLVQPVAPSSSATPPPIQPVPPPPPQAPYQPQVPSFAENAAPLAESLPIHKVERQEIPVAPERAPTPEIQTIQQVPVQPPVEDPQQQAQVSLAQNITPQPKIVDMRSEDTPLKRVADTADSLTTIADLDEQEFIEEVEKIHEH